jgi:hypothetical protein
MQMITRRRTVAAAFRRMANGVEDKIAYRHTVDYYRSSGKEWAKSLIK